MGNGENDRVREMITGELGEPIIDPRGREEWGDRERGNERRGESQLNREDGNERRGKSQLHREGRGMATVHLGYVNGEL